MYSISNRKKSRGHVHCSMNLITAQSQPYGYLQLLAHCFGLSVHMVESLRNKAMSSNFQQTQADCTLPAQHGMAKIRSKQKADEEN